MAERLAVLIALAVFVLPALAGEAGKTVSIVDHGAVGDGKTLCTAAIQQAVDTLIRLEGKDTAKIVLGDYEAKSVRQLVSKEADVPEAALTRRAERGK